MKPFVLETDLDPLQAFARVRDFPYSIFFDSADRVHEAGRYSYIVCNPVEKIEASGGFVTITNLHQQTMLEADPFDILEQRRKAWAGSAETLPDLPPFQGGVAGYFAYETDMIFGVYDQVIAFDHRAGKSWIITHAVDKQAAKGKQAFLLNLVQGKAPAPADNDAVNWKPRVTEARYKKQVGEIIEAIRDGDIFQANLSQVFEAELPRGFSVWDHYRAMRDVNPAPFAGYMNAGGMVIASASPERFLTVQGRKVETRPIKGTRPRFPDDEAMRLELVNSAKDRAENTMIVDLLRNDLSKVCEPDSVDVKALCALESFASVHHLVSTVTGTLCEGENAISLMKACFPGGSITGAPKIRAMEILEEIEQAQRGPYCGSLCWAGFDGAMDSNILIRTLVYEDGKVTLRAGGGITAQSKSQEEYNETLAKAEAIFRSFERPRKKAAA